MAQIKPKSRISPLPLTFILALFCLIVIFNRYILGAFVFIFDDIGSDSMSQFFPRMLEKTFDDSHWLPTWTFHRGMGENILSQDEFSPFIWIQYLLGYKSMATFIIYAQILKLMLAALFTFKTLDLLKLNRQVVIFGTLAAILSGYSILTTGWYGHTDFILFCLAGIWAVEYLIQKKIWWPLTLVFFFIFGTRVLFFLEFILIYLFLRWPDLAEQSNKKEKQKIAINIVLAGTVALLLLGPFIGSVVYNLFNSPRVGGDNSLVTKLSTTPIFEIADQTQLQTALVRMFSPDMTGTGNQFRGWSNYLEAPNFYIGILCLFLTIQSFFVLDRKHKIFYSLTLGFWALIVIFPFFRYAFYFFMGNYYKSGVSFFLSFTLLFISLQTLNAYFEGKRPPVLAHLTSALLCGGGLLYAQSIYHIPDILKWCIILAFLYGMLLLVFSISQKKVFLNALIVISLIEMTGFGFYSQSDRQAISKRDIQDKKYYNDGTMDAVSKLQRRSKDFFRLEKTYGSFQAGFNDASAQNYFATKSYDSHNNNHYIEFLRNYGLLRETEENTRWVLGVVSDFQTHPFLNIRYLLSKPETDKFVWKSMYEKIDEVNGINIFENKYALPLGILVNSVITETDFQKVKAKDSRQSSLYETAVIKNEDLASVSNVNKISQIKDTGTFVLSSLNKLKQRSMLTTHFAEDHIKGSIKVDQSSILTLSIPFDPGWQITVNGQKAQLLQIDYGLMGCKLEPGQYLIDLRYTPVFYKAGWGLFLIGLLILVFQNPKLQTQLKKKFKFL